MPAHLVDDVELVDRDWALLQARAAARACPELLFRDVAVEQAMLEDIGRRLGGCTARRLRAGDAVRLEEPGEFHPVSSDDRALLHQPLPRIDDDLARAEHLARQVCGARGGAAPALGARIAVEQVLPG